MGFLSKLMKNPLVQLALPAALTAVAGPIASGYGNIVDSVDALSSRKMFVNLVLLLKEFVTKAYQLDSEALDYQVIDYRVALKVVEEDIDEEFRDKFLS